VKEYRHGKTLQAYYGRNSIALFLPVMLGVARPKQPSWEAAEKLAETFEHASEKATIPRTDEFAQNGAWLRNLNRFQQKIAFP